MDHQNKKRNRDALDAELDNAQSTSPSFPRFLIIESTVPDEPLSKLSPFVIEKVLVGLAGSPKSVKKLKSGGLLIEVEKATHSKNLMKIKHFFNIPTKCVPHTSLNTSKGIIRCPDLSDISVKEIASELADQNVTAARRITFFRDSVSRPTNTIILTFNTAILPKYLKVGYLKVAVDVYIPNPLQCYCCYKFGHHERNCKLNQGEHVCRRCGNSNLVHSSEDDCEFGIRCINCKGEHVATSRSCPVWKKEKEVVTVKYREGLSFPEARKIVEARYNLGVSYASKATAKVIQHKDAQTQAVDATVQTTQEKPTGSKTTVQQKSITSSQNNQSTSKDSASSPRNTRKSNVTPVQAKAPSSPSQRRHKSPSKVLSDRLPKGSDDEIKQFNRFSSLDEDMEAEDSQAESNTNKQGRTIKLNKR